jgi:RNA polymerase sigma-70 factor (ECF subfamily)
MERVTFLPLDGRDQRIPAHAARGPPPVALALINGMVDVVVAPRGRLAMAMQFEIRDGRITAIDIVAEPDRLRGLDVGLLD